MLTIETAWFLWCACAKTKTARTSNRYNSRSAVLRATRGFERVATRSDRPIWDTPPYRYLKIRPYCVGVDVSDIFFNSTAERLAIYSQFRYISRIFPTMFSQLISIFIRLPYILYGSKNTCATHLGATVSLRYAFLRHAQAY